MAGLIPPHKLEEIRAASDIVEVVRAYLPLKKAGANFTALCPFHHEKTPSFHVNPQRQIFHCFGCQKGGDVFTFVQEYDRLTFIEAVRRLAERAHIALEFLEAGREGAERGVRERLREIHEQLARHWHSLLIESPAGAPARDYLARRAVSPEAIERFRLGYAPPPWNDTVHWARRCGFDPALVEQGGLILRRDHTEGYYGRFRGRLMFPIADEQGRVIGFSGRIIEGDEKSAKYVNSPETPLFTKGRVIFGLDKARRALLDAGHAVICEGQLDLITCHLAGIENVVAPQGTALTAEQCRILKRYVDEVILCFDSDAAGQQAAMRSLADLLGSGLAIRVATVPAPHDPDSYIKEQGAAAFQARLQEATGFFDFLLARLCASNDVRTDRGRVNIVRAMAGNAGLTGNAVTIDAVIRRTAEQLGLQMEAVRRDFRRWSSLPSRAAQSAESSPIEVRDEVAVPRPGVAEYWLLRILLTDDDLAPWAAEHLDPEWIEHPQVREIVRRQLAAILDDTWQGVPHLLAELPDPATRRLVTEAAAEQKEIQNRVKQLMDIVARLETRHLDAALLEVNRGFANTDPGDVEALAALTRRADALRQRKAELRSIYTG
ncbi:MAG: DNA primase [Verrucomicrobiales bacterium]|nr:DNA primase [Verrucomicrobiales bacterium]MCP5527476.1 DNA primase [Verrucomicrobiales bacterium]